MKSQNTIKRLKDLIILIVDDDQFSQLFLRIALNDSAAQIFTASDGYEALELCRDHPGINLILLDIHMPGFSGFETLYEIRKLRPEIIIIAETADITQLNNLLEMGFNSVLYKPIQKNDLLGTIQNQFNLIS